MAEEFSKRINIYIETGQAAAAQKLLLDNQDKLTKKLEEQKLKWKDAQEKYLAAPTEKSRKEVEKLQAAVDKTTESLKKNTEALDRQSKKVKGELDPSLRDLKGSYEKVNRELERMSRQDPGFAQKQAQVINARKAMLDYASSLTSIRDKFRELLNQAKGVAFGVLIGNGVQAMVQSGIAAIKEFFSFKDQFDSAIRNLSAITGATGADLAFLREEAIKLSRDGKRSAVEYVEAMKLIGSAKPELLANKEGLAEVTKQANLLAKASGLDLPTAATKLTDALNQYGAGAEEAAKYVDILAAASKYGAAEVPGITDALLEFGPVAKQSNINMYESAAAIEVLAERGIKGAEAGTKLRNVFLTLAAAKALPKEALESLKAAGVNLDILQDNSLSLEQRLTELSKIAGNTTAMVKVFDKQNVVAGATLLQNIPRLAELTRQVHETGVAAEQASVNVGGSLTGAWGRFTNIVKSFMLSFSTSELATGLNKVSDALAPDSAIDKYEKTKKSFDSLSESVAKLLPRYEELSSKTNLNAGEQEELRQVIDKLSKLVPEAVTEFDAYGRALGINTQAVKENVKAQQDRLRYENREAIQQATKDVQAYNREIKETTKILNQGFFVQEGNFGSDIGSTINQTLTPEDYEKLRARLLELQQLLAGAKAKIDEFKEDAGSDIYTPKKNPFNPLLTDSQKAALNAIVTTTDTGETDEEKKAREKREKQLEEYKKFLEKLAELKRESDAAGEGKDEAETQKLIEKFEKLRVEAQKFYKDKTIGVEDFLNRLVDISAIYDKELAMLGDKQFANRTEKELNATLNTSQKYFDAQKALVKDQYATGVIGKEQFDIEIEKLDSASKHAQVVIFEDYYEALKLAYKDDFEKLAKLEADKVRLQNESYNTDYENYMRSAKRKRDDIAAQDNADVINAGLSGNPGALKDARLKQIQDELDAKLELYRGNEAKINEAVAQAAQQRSTIERQSFQEISGIINEYGGAVIGLFNQISEAQKQNEEQELANDKATNDKKKANLKKQLEAGIISEARYKDQLAALDAQFNRKAAQIKKDQFERDKALRITTTIINTAAAIVSALGTSGNIYAGIALAAIAGATGAAQIGIIAAQQAPSYREGKVGIDGPSHENGGIDMVVNGRKIGELEGNESIMSRAATKKFGGILEMMNRDPNNLNVVANTNNIRQFKNGGSLAGTQRTIGIDDLSIVETRTSGRRAPQETIGIDDLSIVELKTSIRELGDRIEKMQAKPVAFVKYNYDRFNEQQDFVYKRTTFDKK